MTQSINQTYKIGNQLLDYLEKQIIIDYHFRGEQEKLEEQYPGLAEKAKKFLGFEMYYDLSIEMSPLSPSCKYFNTLLKK